MTRALVLILILLIAAFAVSCSCGDDDDDDDAAQPDDDTTHDDDDTAPDDDADDDTVTPDDDVDDDTDDDTGETFPPESQDPLYEKGFILPPDSLECVPEDTGEPQLNCNHHGSTVAELPDGTIAAVWYHGEAEKSKDSRIVWSKREPGKADWTWPEVLYDDPGRAEGNPTLWVHEDGTFYLFFVTIFGQNWDDSKIRLIRSADAGATWTEPTTLRERWCWMTRHRPARLANGDLLLPLYSECLAYPVFIRSPDDFETWTEEAHFTLGYYLAHPGQIQPALTVLGDGTVTAITRDGFPTNRVKRMTSADNGLTWTNSALTQLPNSGTSIDQVRLLDGAVVVVFNNSPTARFPLTVARSLDGGATYDAIRDINAECEGSCSYSYPSIAQSTRDGSIWVTYSYNRQTIGWVHFNEAWLIE
ncbi:MAG: exo-alpha-sialidase [Deltaproteobacteria bacterium]|nr:exo-alpha-sialidase [Deltaproteobacteria bacterium]